jgi:TP901 family phage tail tape measure protein
MRPLTQLSSFISKQLDILDKAISKKAAKAPPAAGGKEVIKGVQGEVKRYIKLLEDVDKAQAKIRKQRLDPVRVTPRARARQAAERRVFGAFRRRGFGTTRVPPADVQLLSKQFIDLMNKITNSRKELQRLSVSIRKNLVEQIGQTSKSIIDQALRFKKVKNVTAATFNALWQASKKFGDKSILTAKAYFAKGIIVGQRGMEKFWAGIKRVLTFIPKKAGGLLRQIFGAIGKTKVGKGVAGAAGGLLGGLSSVFRGLGGLGNITGIIGKISKALGPIGAIISGIVKGVKLAKKAMIDIPLGIIKKAASFALLPLRILNRIHSILQSISFTVYILWSILSRTLREPLEVMKQVEVAMSIAEDNLTGVGKAMEQVVGYAEALPIPIAEIAKGFYEVVRSGFTATEAMTILDAAMQFAVSTGGELNRAIDQIIGILRAFEMDVSEAASIVEVLHKAVGSSRASLADLQIALGYAGPAAISAGLNFKEAVAILTMFRDANLRASRAGMTFRAGLDAIQRAVAAATGGTLTLEKAVKHLGLAWEEMITEEGAINIKNVFREFKTLADKGLTIMDKLAMRAIFQGRHWANWFKLLKMGNEAYEKRLAQLERDIDLSQKVEDLNARIWAIGTRLSNVWTIFKMGILTEAMPSLKNLNRFFGTFISFMKTSAKTIGRIIKEVISEPAMEFLEKHLFPIFEGQRLTKEMENLGKAIKPVMRGMWEDLNKFLEPIMEDVAEGEWTGPVVGGLQIIRALLRGSYTILTQFYGFFKDKWAVLVENVLIVLKIITGIFEFLLPKAEALITFALDAIIGLAQAIGDLAGLSSDKIQEIQDNLRKLKEEAVSGVKDLTKEFVKSGKTATDEVKKVVDATRNIVQETLRVGGVPIIGGTPGQVEEQKQIWMRALEDIYGKLETKSLEGAGILSKDTTRYIGETFEEINRLMQELNNATTIAIRARAQELESEVDTVINRIKNEIERGLGTTKTKHEVEIKVSPSDQFERVIADLSGVMDFDELKKKVEDYSSSVARRVVNNETGAYG